MTASYETVRRLEAAGLPTEHAVAISKGIDEQLQSMLFAEIANLRTDLEAGLADLKRSRRIDRAAFDDLRTTLRADRRTELKLAGGLAGIILAATAVTIGAVARTAR